jgi:polysaccharide biosynthesis transport protein
MEQIRALAVPAERRRRLGARALTTEIAGTPVPPHIVDACTAAMHKMGGPRLMRLGVSSATRGEGRTSVAAAIAMVQAREYGRSAVLVDLDFDRPGVAHRFGLETAPGVAEVLGDLAELKDTYHDVADRLTVVTAGAVTGPPARLASKLMAAKLLARLHSEFDVVVADLPAILDSPCGALLPEAFDEHLLVVRAAVTPVGTVRAAVATLAADPVILLNGTRTRLPEWMRRLLPS